MVSINRKSHWEYQGGSVVFDNLDLALIKKKKGNLQLVSFSHYNFDIICLYLYGVMVQDNAFCPITFRIKSKVKMSATVALGGSLGYSSLYQQLAHVAFNFCEMTALLGYLISQSLEPMV